MQTINLYCWLEWNVPIINTILKSYIYIGCITLEVQTTRRPWFNIKMWFYQYDPLTSTMRFPIMVRWHLYIESGPRSQDMENCIQWYTCSIIYCETNTPLNAENETKLPHFADDIFKRIFVDENKWILLKISMKIVPKFPSMIFQYWFRQWLGADQATSHYLNQWWSVC